MEAPSFTKTYAEFIAALNVTFPEFTDQLKAAAAAENTEAQFKELWKTNTTAIATRDAKVFAGEGHALVPGVVMTAKLWNELSENTHNAIWKFLSSLLLLAASDADGTSFWDISGFHHDMEEMMKALKDSGMAGGMGDLFEKLSKMAGTFGFDAKDLSGVAGKFKLPERLFKGHIAKIAEELVKEFKPEDFGISSEMLESDDPAKVFNYLQEIFTKKPEMLMVSAQKIAKKIQAKFSRGEIKRDDIIREAEELMKEFSENEAFSSLFGSLGEMMKSGEKESGNEGSARRREVQERLRRKAAEKAAARPVPSNTLVIDPSAAAAAAAAMEALVREDEKERTAAATSGKGKKK